MNAATVFPMIPAASKSLWFFVIISLILVGALVLMVWLAWSMQHVRFTVSNEGLRLQGDLYGRLIPLKSLKLEEAMVTNLNTDKDHQPKLRNGEKALLFVTDRTHVARIPTTEGYTVMLSVSEPAALIDELKRQQAVQ